MSDIVERINALADKFADEGMVLRAAVVREAAIEIAAVRNRAGAELSEENDRLIAEIKLLRAGIDNIIGMCLGNVGIGKIHAAACALLASKEGE